MLKIPLTNTYIDLKSFLKKKTPPIDEKNGVYCISGVQGSGKTYYAVQLAKNIGSDYEILTNIHSLKLKHKNFERIDEIKGNFEKHKLFICPRLLLIFRRNLINDKKFVLLKITFNLINAFKIFML